MSLLFQCFFNKFPFYSLNFISILLLELSVLLVKELLLQIFQFFELFLGFLNPFLQRIANSRLLDLLFWCRKYLLFLFMQFFYFIYNIFAPAIIVLNLACMYLMQFLIKF